MTITVVLFFASGHMIGNQQAFAFGGQYYGPGFESMFQQKWQTNKAISPGVAIVF
jgi:hypothetical protein